MARAGITKYDRKISENVLVLGSTDSGKMTLVQEMASNLEESTGCPNYSTLNKGQLK